jgi:alpha-galactosidase
MPSRIFSIRGRRPAAFPLAGSICLAVLFVLLIAPARHASADGEDEQPREPGRLVILPPDPLPALHGPRVVGATPGRPFLFRIPATGEGKLRFTAHGLPAGLTLDPAAGIIRGVPASAGNAIVKLEVRGAKGVARRSLTIECGPNKLVRTPPMGWNTFNIWSHDGSQQRVWDAADWMVKSGLAGHGYQYVNIDDCWEGVRDANGVLGTNAKFPDMRGLIAHIHSLGLKAGIYSSPGPTTCKGLEGSYKHEEQDAAMFANWGIDYLKYDWCSYTEIVRQRGFNMTEMKRPFLVMRAALDKTGHDIVFSLSQAGVAAVWKWGAEVGANVWRTSGDLHDNWTDLSGDIAIMSGHEAWAGPGHWNDPDMLVVGRVGWGSPRENHLTQNEQILHFSLWCLTAAPLIMGCDLSQVDPFAMNVLGNDEAIEIDQDPLARAASRVFKDDDLQIWARPLWDGTHAVGLINMGLKPADMTARWSDVGVTGAQPVRDLWLHKDVGTFQDSYTVSVPARGCVLLKIGRPQPIK